MTARELLDRGVARADELSDQPEVQAEMLVESQLGRCLTMLGHYAEAEPLLVRSYPILAAEYGEADRPPQEARQYLVDLYTTQGRRASAIHPQRS